MKKEFDYDCIVIGGGPAGLMAAIQAAAAGGRVAVLDKNNLLCKKLRITGKGRCNLTNDCDFDTLMANIPRNPKFLFSAFKNFSNTDVIDFFHTLGLQTVTERGGRVFPATQKAGDVAGALISCAKANGIAIFLNTRAVSIHTEDNGVCGVCCCGPDNEQKRFSAPAVIVATGGLSYPLTGSTGDGYRFAEDAGHTIAPPHASLAALLSRESFIPELEGLSLKNISVSLLENGVSVYRDFGELLFTGSGVSGPVILSASAYYKPAANMTLIIDLKPALEEQKLYDRLQRDFAAFDRKIFSNALDRLLPKKLIPVIIERTKIPPGKQVNQLSREERRSIVHLLKHFTVRIDGIDDVKNAIVTAGGVSVREIDPKTMASKICRGLYFAGEVLDVDGYTGGFNLTIAFSTGFSAGRAVGKRNDFSEKM